MEADHVVHALSPGITAMIRLDHSHVLTMSHRYRANASPERKRLIADAVCLALEIHAQLEEEIFYPALEVVLTADEVLGKSRPEHDEVRRLIGRRRSACSARGSRHSARA
ncbi:hemerythrin domain-containing protein [Aquincola agrisoli]|uniref:hemerythrin domain-containing protein n=1 Tax=Aquincola TaxID=391952 RepID=UPI003610DE57